MQSHQLTTLAAKDFIHGGNAIFTVVVKKTGNRYTFKVYTDSKDNSILNVGLLIGSYNLNDYRKIGWIGNEGFKVIKSVHITISTPSVMCFMYVYSHLMMEADMPLLEIWHEGRCCRCGRLLTVPESIENGIGPECIKKMYGIN